MSTLFVAALLALADGSAQSPAAAATPVAANVDSARERQVLSGLLTCLVEQRPRWGRRTLAEPYLSDQQHMTAQEILRGNDTCMTGARSEVVFRTSSVVASLAEHFLREDIGRVDFGRVTRAISTMQPLNVSEDFALCVASRDPAAARDLALSEFGSSTEAQAARRLGAHVSFCTNPGENLTVDMQALRALSAMALYRGVTHAMGSN